MTKKKLIINAARIIFLVAPVLWLFFVVDYKSVAVELSSVHWAWVLLLFAVVFLHFILQSLRFWFLITPFCDKIKASEFVVLNLKARYYSAILPSSAGLDLSRGLLLRRHLSIAQIIAVSLFFRITGIIMLVLLSVFGFLQLYSHTGINGLSVAAITVALMFLGLCAIMVVSLNEKASDKVLSVIANKLPKKIRDFIITAVKSILLYRNFPKRIVATMIFSFFLHVLFLIFPIAAIFAISGELKIVECLGFIPLIEIISASIPISPNGAGVREGLSILFFDFIGLTPEQAFSYVALSVILYLWMFSGFFVILFEKMRNKRKEVN